MAVAANHAPCFATPRRMQRYENAQEDIFTFGSPARPGFNGVDAHR
jgi:hypothetical protein